MKMINFWRHTMNKITTHFMYHVNAPDSDWNELKAKFEKDNDRLYNIPVEIEYRHLYGDKAIVTKDGEQIGFVFLEYVKQDNPKKLVTVAYGLLSSLTTKENLIDLLTYTQARIKATRANVEWHGVLVTSEAARDALAELGYARDYSRNDPSSDPEEAFGSYYEKRILNKM